MQLPLADNSVDLLVSNLMLQWCNDLPTVFREWVRVLKPQGALLFSTFGPDTLKELRDSWMQVDTASHVNLFIDMHDIGDMLWQSGFINPVMDVDWTTRWHIEVMTLVRELKALGAHNITAGRPQGLTGKGKWQAMTQAYEEHRQSTGLPATYEVIYGYAMGKRLDTPQRKQAKEIATTTIPISQIQRRQK
jgi:malonyl-CoA O-methyltransferase